MKTKYFFYISGSLFFLSFLIPPGFYKFSLFDLSEILIFTCLIVNIVFLLYKNSKNKIFSFSGQILWKSFFIYLFILFLITRGDSFILRLIFFTFVGYSIYLIFKFSPGLHSEYFLFPSVFIVVVNFLLSIFQISFSDNTLGWINYFYEEPNFFQMGRLSGLQGSGPNVAGALFAFLALIYLSYFLKTNKKFYLFFSILSLYLVFISFSRGSYIALVGVLILFVVLNDFSWKKFVYSFLFVVISGTGFIYFGNSEIILKESDRTYLTNIALENIEVFNGLGGGNYVREIYKNYLLSLDPEILEESLNIKLNKVELGITPEKFRDSNIDFYIGTSGSGYEILQNSFIVNECEYDRQTCQYQRITKDILAKFASVIMEETLVNSKNYIDNSDCLDDSAFISRGEFGCFVKSIKSPLFTYDFKVYEYTDVEDDKINNDLSFLKFNYMFPECELTATFGCPDREMAIGELAVLIESIVYEKEILPIENFEIYCNECSYKNVYGFIKFEFDKIQGFLPRSIFTFSTSENGVNWQTVGSERTTGNILEFNKNTAYLEIGGHSDGQSFGNTFLDAEIISIKIKDKDSTKTVKFNETNLNRDYFVFKPNSYELYTSKITFLDDGLKLFRPNKYWLAIENTYDFDDNFEIIIELVFPEVPWERQTLISNTSSGKNEHQSWKIDIDDGRFFLQWADKDGAMKDNYIVGDKSLRSGILSQKNGFLTNKNSPIVDPSNLSQLTTAHNGYLTFSVEFGLFWSLIFYAIMIFSIIYIFQNIDQSQSNLVMFLSLVIFMITNLTNDMIYSPDIYLLFIFCLANTYSLINASDKRKS